MDIYVCKAGSYDEKIVNDAVERVFAACECAKTLGANTRACVKINVIGRHAPSDAATTHPAVLCAVILALQKRGVTDITVADSAGGAYNESAMTAIYKACGITQVCQKTGVSLYTACKWSGKKAQNYALVPQFNVIQPVLDADFIINVPKLKTHMMMRLTNATKNLFGVIPGLQKAELHMRFPKSDKFGAMLVDLCETIKPNLTVVDAIDGMEGDGPNSGTPRHIGLIMGGESTYLLDLAACEITGISPADVPYMANAISRGLCKKSFAEVEIGGDIGAVKRIDGYKLPANSKDATFAAHQSGVIGKMVALIEKSAAPHPVINAKKCVGCARCADICPAHTINLTNKKAHIDKKACIRCFCCHEVCPADAIDVKRLSFFNI